MIDESMKERVMEVFDRLQNHQPYVPIISEIEDFAKDLHADGTLFAHCFQQGYLKICKKLKATSCQIPEVFVNVVSTLTEFVQKVNTSKKSETKFEEKTIINFNQFQLKLFAKLSMSKILSIRIFGAKLLFTLLKGINPPLSHHSYEVPILQEVIKSILLLIAEKNKILKRHGLKLSSLVQQVEIVTLSKQLKYLKNEVLGIIKTNQDEQTRQVAFNNLILNKQSLNEFILRLRDKNPKIRETVYKKLSSQKLQFWDLGLHNVYKILYDGMSAQNKQQRQECINYFYRSFGKEIPPNPHSSLTKNDPNSSFYNFLKFMRPSLLIQQPILLSYFQEIIKSIFIDKSTSANFTRYLKSLCQRTLSNNQCSDEIFYIRILAQCPNSNYFKPLQELILSFGHISQLLWNSFVNNRYFQITQLLKLTEANVNSDQIGKEKLTQTLYKILQQPIHYKVETGKLDYPTDVCIPKSDQQIIKNRVLLSEYQTHPIHSTIDLIPGIVKCLLNLNQRQKVQIQLKQIIDNLINKQTGYRKEAEINKVSLNKLKQSGQIALISEFEKKVKNLSQKQQIVRLRYAWLTYYLYTYTKETSFEVFTTVYDIVYSYDLPLALLILGTFVLNNPQRLTKQYEQLWQHCLDSEQGTLQKLVCIRCLTDLSIKFRPGKLKTSQHIHFQTFISTTLSHSLFSDDKQLRIVAIQSFCRLLYNNTIAQPMLYFVYLMILWFDTNSPTKSIHLISTFIKSYIEKSQSNLTDISQYLQILILTFTKLQSHKNEINKKYVNYPMKHQAFLKKLISIAMNILKYKGKVKEYKQVFYNPRTFGPQQSFVLCILQQRQLHKYVDILLQKNELIHNSTPQQLCMIKSIVTQNQDLLIKNSIKTFLQQVCRYLNVEKPNGQIVCILRNVLSSSQSQIRSYSDEVIRSLGDMRLIQKLENDKVIREEEVHHKIKPQIFEIEDDSDVSDQNTKRLNQ